MKKQKIKSGKPIIDPAKQASKQEEPLKEYRFTDWLAVAIIVVLGVLIYANSFNCSFHFDDRSSIEENTLIRDLSNLKALWQSSPTRFVSYFTFALNYHFGELNVWGYHLVNLLIHLANACLVYGFTVLIFSTPALKENALARDKKTLAFAAALLFVSHPLATQSVTYIVQRMASLVTLFYLLSLCFYVKARLSNNRKASQYLLFAACFVSALLALLTKENAFTLPLAIVLFEIFFLRTKERPSGITNYRIGLLMAVLLGVVMMALLMYPGSILKPLPPGLVNDYRTITPLNYLFTQFSVIVKYIGLLLLPVNQNLDYDYPLSNGFFEGRTMLSFVLLLSLFIAGVSLFKKYRVLSFGIFWFFLTLSIESSIIPISDLIFEHRTYLPSVGFFIVLSTGLYLLLWNRYRTIAMVAFFAIIASNAYLTFQRNKIWKDERSLWNDVISKSPNKSRGYYNLGLMSSKEGKIQEALKDFDKAITLQPNYPDVYNVRGSILSEENYEKALEDYNKAISLRPRYDEAYNNRGLLLNKKRLYEQALNDFNKAIEITPKLADAYYNRGITYGKLNQPDKSIADFTKAIEINPKDVKSYNSRGNMLMNEKKDLEAALKDFNKAVELEPAYPTAYSNRGALYMNEKNYEKAYSDFSKAIALKPDFAEAYYNRGFAAYNLGKMEMACQDMKQALNLGCQPARDALNQVCN